MSDPDQLQVDLPSFGGVRISVEVRLPKRPIGAIVLCHGVCEHRGRYARFINALNQASIASIAFDLRGHGTSSGKRCHVERFDDYLCDLEQVTRYIEELSRDRSLGTRRFLFGHSMGGVVVSRYLEAQSNQARYDGLVLSSPGFARAIDIPKYKQVLATLLTAALPSAALQTGIPTSAISSDLIEEQAYANDPLVTRKVTLRWFAEFERAGVVALSEANRLFLPIYAFAGANDTVIRLESVERFVNAAASSEKTYRLWEGLRHETLNERQPERDAVTYAVIDWISARCSIK